MSVLRVPSPRDGQRQDRRRHPVARRLTAAGTAAASFLALGLAFATPAFATPAAAAGATTTPQDVIDAFTSGGTLTLDNDVTVPQGLALPSGKTLRIDLGSHTLTVQGTPGGAGTFGATTGTDGDGLPGGAAITNDGTLTLTDGNLDAIGGAGGEGATGRPDNPDGGPAGSGGAALANTGTLLVAASTRLLGGTGGAGGNGEDSLTAIPGRFGGNAGPGGDGSPALANSGIAVVTGSLRAIGGVGGAGGSGGHGAPGDAQTPGGNGGSGGIGGVGGDSVRNDGTLAYPAVGGLGMTAGIGGAGGTGGLGGAAGQGTEAGTAGEAGTSGNGGRHAVVGTNATAVTLSGSVTAPPDAYTVNTSTVGDAEAALTLLPQTWPARAGYALAGWYTGPSGGDPVAASTPTSGQTVYAHWDLACSAATFTAQFDGAADGSTVTLCGDLMIPAASTDLAVAAGRSVTLDLAGHSLTIAPRQARGTAGIGVPATAALTVEDTVGGGKLDVTGGGAGAGIGGAPGGGGNLNPDAGSITIAGGTVTATGGLLGAGIGGGPGGTGGTGHVTITGGTVTATGGEEAAGIGGGAGIGGAIGKQAGAGGVVTISGGTVTATGSAGSAGIGGGAGLDAGGAGNGAAVSIGANATVTASSSGGGTAIGAGAAIGGATGTFGSLSNAGTLTIPAGNSITVPPGITVTNSGLVDGDGTLTGAGTIGNSGSIRHTVTVDTGAGLAVTDHDYALAFDLAGGTGGPAGMTVYAADLAGAGLSTSAWPDPTRPGRAFTGWYLDATGTGAPVTDTTALSGSSATGTPLAVPIYAGWEVGPAITTTVLPHAEVGSAYSASLTAGGGTGPYTWSVPAGGLPGGLTLSGSTISGTPHAAGTSMFLVRVKDSHGATASRQLWITVAPICSGAPPFPDVATSGPDCGAIAWMRDRHITSGYGDGFHPTAPVTRQTMAAFLYRYTHDGTDAPACTSAPFTDVPTSNPFCGAITWLVGSGITNGYSDHTFGPTQTVTEQTAAAFLYRLAHDGNPAPPCTTAPFADVPAGSPFCGAIAWMTGTGIVDVAPDGDFGPTRVVTREAMADDLYFYDQYVVSHETA